MMKMQSNRLHVRFLANVYKNLVILVLYMLKPTPAFQFPHGLRKWGRVQNCKWVLNEHENGVICYDLLLNVAASIYKALGVG
jgi:hypothetical protein